MPEGPSYDDKKAFYRRVLTVYGRKPVLEALLDGTLEYHALHLARSNRQDGIVAEILQRAQEKGVTVKLHTRPELARVSRNGRQDQGVALDILCPTFRTLQEFLAATPIGSQGRMLALDGISNPQNLGMIVRSAAAGQIDGIIIPGKGNAALGPLVIKASAGTLYRAPLLLCDRLPAALEQLRAHGATICALDAKATQSLFERHEDAFCVYVLGSESTGLSPEVLALADRRLAIPMRNGVESLNVAVTASLIAFAPYLDR